MHARPLTTLERAICDRLLSEPFPGRDELRQQLEHAQADADDPDDEFVAFCNIEGPPASAITRVPVELWGKDAKDGEDVQVMLHVADEGKAYVLEFLKLANDEPINLPDPEQMMLLVATK